MTPYIVALVAGAALLGMGVAIGFVWGSQHGYGGQRNGRREMR